MNEHGSDWKISHAVVALFNQSKKWFPTIEGTFIEKLNEFIWVFGLFYMLSNVY